MLDNVYGGGLPSGRIINIVGDKSTGKTLLAIEAVSNFLLEYPEGKVYYCEVEASFDKDYARAMGMPVDQVEFVGQPTDEDDDDFVIVSTVEDLFRDFETRIETHEGNDIPGLYVIDSLDALSDEAEQDRDIGKGSYGTAKAKQISETLRRLNGKINSSNITLIVVSQIRDKINAMFGKKYQRSGGHALDFYASVVVWLSQLKILTKTIKGIKRPIGVHIKAKCEKNKVGLPFRECEFDIVFGYGVDDIGASLDWLKSVKRLDDVGLSDSKLKKYVEQLNNLPLKKYNKEKRKISKATRKAWNDIEVGFLPTRSKY